MNAHQPIQSKQVIHLLYVPTIFCNLGCQYCYLGEQTNTKTLKKDQEQALGTLEFALAAFLKNDILPFNVSLHGGEVTTLPADTLDGLFTIIRNHYHQHHKTLVAQGFKKAHPHIKTNLFNFHKLYDLMVEHQVSISASVDLPLSLHEKYRTTKQGKSTLERTLQNVRLLGNYPHYKKMSSVLYREHFDKTDELIEDIWHIHNELGFDMNYFNFMFGFESELNDIRFTGRDANITQALPDELQVEFYQKMKNSFMGTELEMGLKRHWFDEFKPSYCTNAFNCGERFFLLQGDGNIYSCVRGQGVEPFHYGNIYTDSVESIMNNGQRKINVVHQQQGLDKDCKQCDYIHICHTGCAVVKQQRKSGKSYTCALQKAIYKDNPELYPSAQSKQHQKILSQEYALSMHPDLTSRQLVFDLPEKETLANHRLILPNDLNDNKNTLGEIIEKDSVLQTLYSNDAIVFELEGDCQTLASQILKPARTVFSLSDDQCFRLHIRKSFFAANCSELIRNTLFLQMLSNNKVIYGDEQRSKQAHIFSYQVYYDQLSPSEMYDDYVMLDLTGLFKLHSHLFKKNVLNNFFVTTHFLREYHYQKQKMNGFYHIQAINLPFQNLEFYWS